MVAVEGIAAHSAPLAKEGKKVILLFDKMISRQVPRSQWDKHSHHRNIELSPPSPEHETSKPITEILLNKTITGIFSKKLDKKNTADFRIYIV